MDRVNPQATEWRLVEGEVIGLNLATQEYFRLTGTAAKLWPLLIEGSTEVSLTQRLRDDYGVDQTTAASDVRSFLEQLRGQGLLETSQP